MAIIEAVARLTDNIIWVDEYLTSQLCCNCGKKVKGPMASRVGGSSSRAYHLRRCPHCKTWWQRDVNAAAAMVLLADAALPRAPRPLAYQR